MFMFNRLKLIHYKHSGRLQPHEHTSYASIGILLLIVGLVMSVYTVNAATPYDGPEAGSIGLTGIMPGKPPTIAATIDTPATEDHTGTSPVNISGTCPTDTLVEIFKNDIFGGSTPCSEAGLYTIDVDLLIGKNILIAKVYDALNQVGPDSNSVVVYYDALPAQTGPITSLNLTGAQMLLNTDAVFRGVFPNQELNIPVEILSGTPPFALNVQWGDTTNKVVPRDNNVGFNVGHTYTKAGTYQVTLQATDAVGRVAFLSVAAIVNGQPAVVSGSTTSTTIENKLLVLWPLYASMVAIAFSFYVGEKREKYILKKRGLLTQA